jgi:hypothetical protein
MLCHASVNERSNWLIKDYIKKESTDVQASFLVGELGLLVVALDETYGCPSKKGGSNFVHRVNIDGAAISSQGSNPASEIPVEMKSVP